MNLLFAFVLSCLFVFFCLGPQEGKIVFSGTTAMETVRQPKPSDDDDDLVAFDDPASVPATVALRHGDALEEEGVMITPQNIAIQYYRRETLRMATIAIALALIDLFVTPIDAFILLPAAIAASYWLRDTVRFSHGGDLRKCFNRDCALMYFLVCCGVSLSISALDCVILIANASRSEANSVPGSTSSTPSPIVVRSHDVSSAPAAAAVAGHSSSWFALAIGVNACSFVTLMYGFYCTRKLRRLLEQGFGDGSQTTTAIPHVEAV